MEYKKINPKKASYEQLLEIVNRFGFPFILQAEKDLKLYPLYDAIGMWLDSGKYVDDGTYKTIEEIARDFLNGKFD